MPFSLKHRRRCSCTGSFRLPQIQEYVDSASGTVTATMSLYRANNRFALTETPSWYGASIAPGRAANATAIATFRSTIRHFSKGDIHPCPVSLPKADAWSLIADRI